MSIQDLYRSAVIEHNREPRNFEELQHATHRSRGLNALCGDDIRVFVQLGAERIERLSFIGQASAITIASASMMTELAAGLTAEEVGALADCLDELLRAETVTDELRDQLGELTALEGVRQYPSRIKSARLPWQTLKAALAGDPVATTE